MVFYALYLFNRNGKCLYYNECNKRRARRGKPEEEQKTLFGMLHALKSFCNHINPVALDANDNEPLYSYTTKGYKLHYFETLSGLRFVLTTDPNIENLQVRLPPPPSFPPAMCERGFCFLRRRAAIALVSV